MSFLDLCCETHCDELAVEGVGRAMEIGYVAGHAPTPAAARSFTTALLGNGADDPKACLGVTLDCLDGQTAFVGRLWEHGRLAACNSRAGRSVNYVGECHHLVHPGDYIVAVNDVNGPVKTMVELLLRGGALELRVATAEEFSVSFDSGDGSCQSLGLTLKWCKTGWSLLIVGVGLGLVQDWNHAHPEQQVRPNDRIVAIDGYRVLEENHAASECSDLTRLLDQLTASSVLTISRPAIPLCSAKDSGIESIVNLDTSTAPNVLDVGSGKGRFDHMFNDCVSTSASSTRHGLQSERTSSSKEAIGVKPSSKRRKEDYFRQLEPTSGYFELGCDSWRSRSRAHDHAGRATSKPPPETSTSYRWRGEENKSITEDGKLIVEMAQSKGPARTPTSIGTTALDDSRIPDIGERVYFCAGNQVFPSGDVLEFGTMGNVINVAHNCITPRSGSKSSTFVDVEFPGTKQNVRLPPTHLALSYPILPGGFRVGDEVIFMGKSPIQVSDTDTLTPGLHGEVVGLATTKYADSRRQRLTVHFDGHVRNTPLPVTAVRKVLGSVA